MTAAAPAHDGDGADLGTGAGLGLRGKRGSSIRAGAVIAGMLQHQIHEPRAPQAAAVGGIAAEVAARFGHEARGAKAGETADAGRSTGIDAGTGAGIGIGKPARLHLRDAAIPVRCARYMAIVVPVMMLGVMPDVMGAGMPPCAVVRSC